MEQCLANIIHPVIIHRSTYWWAECISHFIYMAHTGALMQAQWEQKQRLEAVQVFGTFCTTYMLHFLHHLGDSEGRRLGEGGWEGENGQGAGREEEWLFWSLWTVITTYSCFLPGAPTGHQHKERERTRTHLCSLGNDVCFVYNYLDFITANILISSPFQLQTDCCFFLLISPCRQRGSLILEIGGSWRAITELTQRFQDLPEETGWWLCLEEARLAVNYSRQRVTHTKTADGQQVRANNQLNFIWTITYSNSVFTSFMWKCMNYLYTYKKIYVYLVYII